MEENNQKSKVLSKYGNYGNKNPSKRPEVREKIRQSKLGSKNPFFGKTHSIEWRKKLSEKFSGENNPMYGVDRSGSKNPMFGKKRPLDQNPNWQGGKSFEIYPICFNRELKESIRKIDDYCCQMCGLHQNFLKKALDVHHIDYNKKNCSISNLISLCKNCHMKTNHKRNEWKEYFKARLNK